jgi:hypothetical protein
MGPESDLLNEGGNQGDEFGKRHEQKLSQQGSDESAENHQSYHLSEIRITVFAFDNIIGQR